MLRSRSGTRSRVRGGMAAVLLLLLLATTACAKEEEKEPAEACGLIDPELVTELADGRDWNDVGTLYRDGKFTDGCAVVVSGEQLLLITLSEFDSEERAASAKQTLTAQRQRFEQTCPDTTQPPVTDDRVTAACLTEQKLDYDEWNPQRLVRLTIDQTPGVTLSADDGARIMEDLNKNADKLEE